MKLLAATTTTPAQAAQQLQQAIAGLQALGAAYPGQLSSIQPIISNLQSVQATLNAQPTTSVTAASASTGLSPAASAGLGAIGGFLVGAVAAAAWKGKK